MAETLSDAIRTFRASISVAEAPAVDSATEQRALGRTPDPREVHAAPCLYRFLPLAAQLAGLLLVFHLYHLLAAVFVWISAVVFGTFLVHYWLPFRLKEPFWVSVSMAGAFWLLEPRAAALLIAVGLAFFLILRSPAPFRWRVLLVSAIFAVLIYGCATKRLPIPASFYPVFGAVFMFRIIIYAYDLAHGREPARLLPFLSYFFLLPNYYFMLFPVIDFQTMRQSYYRRDIHEIAQQGIQWIVRGTIQLMLYRVVLYLNDPYLPDRVTSLGTLIATMVLTFLLYLNVSGTFHLIVGMLHLFGYDLPETNRRYLFASSFVDFWRRINIYWKDFMVKIVYFPAYFKLRKQGEFRAQILATAAVFLTTWVLHSYQLFWIGGRFALKRPDIIFWGILGVLVIANVLYEARHKRRQRDSSWQGRALQAVQILATFTVITTLWSLWSSPTVNGWIYLMTHWIRSSR
jgi:D-alanyl-lipoteichoic acid acyltransferase DltB (MBOAT superfamily)